MDIVNVIVDILAKRLPASVNINPTKLEQVIHKIKLVVTPPEFDF
jgi:hypothetical protein